MRLEIKIYNGKSGDDRKEKGPMQNNCSLARKDFNTHLCIPATGFTAVCNERLTGRIKGRNAAKPFAPREARFFSTPAAKSLAT